MSKSTEPWQTAEIPGPKKAFLIPKPEVVAAMIKNAKRPLLIVGHEAADFRFKDERLIDYLVRFAKNAKIPVVATAHVQGEFFKKGFQADARMPVVDIANRLVDPGWKGLDGQGPYDLALFIGIPYYIEWLVLSSIKHFSRDLKTVSMDMHYQPHASWSFPNLSVDEWENNLKIIIDKTEKK